MKKALIIAFAALLVLAFSLPAMAQTKVEFSGSYRVRWHYKSNFNLADDGNALAAPGFPANESLENFLDQRFRMSVRFMPSDALTLTIDTEANDTTFGNQAAGGVLGVGATGYGTQTAQSGFAVAQDAGTLELYHSYMTIKTQVGAFSLGRMPGGVAGLALLGYSGGYRGNINPFDTEAPRDRLRWIMPAGPLTVGLVYDQRTEYDSRNLNATQPGTIHDSDRSEWAGILTYKFASGGFSLVVLNVNDHDTLATTGVDADVNMWIFFPAVVLNFGPIGIHGEIAWADGEMDITNPLATDVDLEGLGIYFDVTYNYGPGEVGAHYTFVQGDDIFTPNSVEGMLGWGGDYEPYMIATAYATNNPFDIDEGSGGGFPGMHQYGLWVNHNLTEDMMLSAAFGFMTVDEPGTVGGVAGAAAIDDGYGTEFDVGLQWQLMSNLRWRVDLGYFWAGDWFKQGVAAAEVGNAWALQNELTLTF